MPRCLLCLLAAVLLAAQTNTEVEITSEPHHHLTLENESVRVFNVEVAPHADTLMHWHRHDYVFVTLGASHVLNEVMGKGPVELKLPDGDTHFSPATFAHVARNLSDQPFFNVTIEYLQDEKLRNRAHQGGLKWDEERGLDVLQGGTRQVLFVNDGVRVSAIELQPGGLFPKHLHTGAHLLVAVSDLDLREKFVNDVHPSETGHLKRGESKWLTGGYSHTVTNVGRQPAKFVTLEFPPN